MAMLGPSRPRYSPSRRLRIAERVVLCCLQQCRSGLLRPTVSSGLALSVLASFCSCPVLHVADGQDPSIKQLLERTYLDQYREPLPELGPHVPVGVPRRKALRTSFPPRERTPSRPEGRLVAHLSEHTAAINAIDVAPDQLFFVTASEDGTVKVWDCMRLEKNVTSKSRQTYQQGGKITSVCILEHSHCIASASSNGSVWIHRVDISLSGQIPRYSKPHRVRQYTVDGGDHATCLASFNTGTLARPCPFL